MDHNQSIAVIGMAGKFPGARNVDEFWENLLIGKESIRFFEDEELAEIAGVDLHNPSYVKAKGFLEDADCFDASFFGWSPKHAALTDPQHRILLETAYLALENAGCDPQKYVGDIGVFASMSPNTYLFHNIRNDNNLLDESNYYQTTLGNSADFLATRISYELNLTGPAQTIQTGCSSSLVAIHYACQSILNFECDVALAGGVSVTLPFKSGYLYKAGGIGSPDGHCRPFDNTANGTIAGNGSGVVVLKRLSDAIADGDRIYAIIKGSAINNDGGRKTSFTAPSVTGQSKAIQMAQTLANVEPETIRYVEAHGTGTYLGDPIEIESLSKAFGGNITRQQCAIGSVKGNIGHLDAAAGVAGFIKCVLSVYHKTLVPSINYKQANKNIKFDDTPFYVNTERCAWPEQRVPARAAVSAFGIGGTNAHVILEEFSMPPSAPAHQNQSYIFPISAKTPEALEILENTIKYFIHNFRASNVADIEYTLIKRAEYDCRKILIGRFTEYGITIDDYNEHDIATQSLTAERLEYIRKWLSQDTVQTDFTQGQHIISLVAYPFTRTRCVLESAPFNRVSKTSPSNQIADSNASLTQKLTHILSSLLGSENISLDATFSDIGADSLMLIDFALLAESQLAVKLPLEILATHNSIQLLATYIETNILPLKASNPAQSTLLLASELAIQLKQGDRSLPPLFCIHPAGGSISVFQQLASFMPANQPVIGIRGAQELINASIETLAAHYKKIIQSVCSHGPYYLCGSSVGGTIALEIARALQSDGFEVPVLAMLDTPPPSIHLSKIPESNEEVVSYLDSLSPTMAKDIQKIQKSSPDTYHKFFNLWRSHSKALLTYKGSYYAGKILYFKAREYALSTEDFDKGWMELTEKLDVTHVNGNHLTMHASPHVEVIAKTLATNIRTYWMNNYQHTASVWGHLYA